MFISPAVAGDTVIAGSCAGSVYALDRATGKARWEDDTRADGPKAQFHGEPLLAGKRLIVAADAEPQAHLYAFDSATGEVLWKVPFANGVTTSPMLVGERIVVASAMGEVAAVDPATGAVKWRVSPAGAIRTTWSPVASGKRVFVALGDKLFAIDAVTGATLWQTALPARANTSLAIAGKHVVAGTFDGTIVWVAIDSGEITKRVHLDKYPYGTIIAAPPLLFVLSGGNLLALDAESGAVRWKRETPREWTTYRPLVSGADVIAGTEEKELCAFDRATGETRWCADAGVVPRGLGAADDVLYVGALSGAVQAIRAPESSPRPSRPPRTP